MASYQSLVAVDLRPSRIPQDRPTSLVQVAWARGFPEYLSQRQASLSAEEDSTPFLPTLISATHDVRLIGSKIEGVVDLSMPIAVAALDDDQSTLRCVFFNRTTKLWSDAGCKTGQVDFKEGRIGCECDHMTEFAVLQRKKAGQTKKLPYHITMIYTAFLGIFASIAVYSAYQLHRIVLGGALSSWTGYAHTMLVSQCSLRVLSCLFFGSVVKGFNPTETQRNLTFLIAALPYTVIFFSVSLVPFQWMSIVKNTELRSDPWRPHLNLYIGLNCAVVVAIWFFFVMLWNFDIRQAALVGSIFFGVLCSGLLFAYSVYGLMLRRALMLMSDNSGDRKRTPDKLIILAPFNAVCFAGMTVTWVVSGLFGYTHQIRGRLQRSNP